MALDFLGGGFLGRSRAPAPKPVAIPLNRPAPRPVAVPQPMTLGRGEEPNGQRTDKAVDHGLVGAFLAGTLTYVTSSNVRASRFDRRDGTLTLWFLNGSAYRYADISEEEAAAFYNAPSKGGFVADVLKGPGYPRTHRKPYARIA